MDYSYLFVELRRKDVQGPNRNVTHEQNENFWINIEDNVSSWFVIKMKSNVKWPAVA
jgi:hypothetical protein